MFPVIKPGDDDAAANAAASMNPDETKRFFDMVGAGTDKYHALNLIHSQRAQAAAAAPSFDNNGNPMLDTSAMGAGDKLRAAAVNAGDAATGGGLSTLSALATSMPDLRPDFLRRHSITFGDGSGSNTSVDEEKGNNARVLADVQAAAPTASGLGALGGLLAPLAVGGVGAGARVAGAAPSIGKAALQGAGAGGGFGALSGLLNPGNHELGDYAENAGKGGALGAAVGGAFGGAGGLNDALKGAGGIRNLLNEAMTPAPAPPLAAARIPSPSPSPGGGSVLADLLKVISPRLGHAADAAGKLRGAFRGAPPPEGPPAPASAPSYGLNPRSAPPMQVPGAYAAPETTEQMPIGELNTAVRPAAAAPQSVDDAMSALAHGPPGVAPVPEIGTPRPMTPPMDLSFLGRPPVEDPLATEHIPPPFHGTPPTSAPIPSLADAAGNADITPPMSTSPSMLNEMARLQHDTMQSASPNADTAMRPPAPAPPPGVAPVFRGEATPVPGDPTSSNGPFTFGGRHIMVDPESPQQLGGVNVRLARAEDLPDEVLMRGPPTANLRVPGATPAPSPTHGALQPSLFGAEEPSTSPNLGPWDRHAGDEAANELMAVDPSARSFLQSPTQYNPANRVAWQGAHDSTRAAATSGMKGTHHGRVVGNHPPRSGSGFDLPGGGSPFDAMTRRPGDQMQGPATTDNAFEELLRQLGINPRGST